MGEGSVEEKVEVKECHMAVASSQEDVEGEQLALKMELVVSSMRKKMEVRKRKV